MLPWCGDAVVSRGPASSEVVELAMLGITPTRSATILAASLCILWEVTQDCHTRDPLAAGGYGAACGRQKKRQWKTA